MTTFHKGRSEAGRIGGMATKHKMGVEHYRRIGKIGGKARRPSSAERRQSDFVMHIVTRLPSDYVLTQEDFQWLRVCAGFWDGFDLPASYVKAVREAVRAGREHHDPFELLIAARICDQYLNPSY